MKVWFILALLLAGAAMGFGIFMAVSPVEEDPGFHDMRVIRPEQYRSLVTPAEGEIVALAGRLGTPEAVYLFVRDRIVFDPSRPATTPLVALREGRASCLGKAALLTSLYRALGIPSGSVRVVTGQVDTPGNAVEHAWLEVEIRGFCLQQDPTSLLGVFPFDRFPGYTYTRDFILREHFCFNDEAFGIVSQTNLFRGVDHPMNGVIAEIEALAGSRQD